MLNEASLNDLRHKLMFGLAGTALTAHERAFLASLIANHVTGVQANELYLTPTRPSITQPIPRSAFLPRTDAEAANEIVHGAPDPDDFPQSPR